MPGDGPEYRRPDDIGPAELRSALAGLELFSDDPYLRMQAFNLEAVDRFIMHLESDVMEKLGREERTPMPETQVS